MGDVRFPGQPYYISYDHKLHVGFHFSVSSSALINAFEEAKRCSLGINLGCGSGAIQHQTRQQMLFFCRSLKNKT